MTIEAMAQRGSRTTPIRKSLRLLCTAVLCLSALPALAQSAPADAAATGTPSSSAQAPRNRADAAATAALAALLPRLAGNDTIPLMDRSAMFAGDLSRLLASYDVSQGSLVGAQGNDTGKVQSILRGAMALLGTPYRWGGEGPEGFDCSGLVNYVFKTALGVELPRVSREMARKDDAELIKDPSALAAGDLVFFGRKGHVDHVGIYVGDGRFLHAPRTGKDVQIDSLTSGYWSQKFIQARRVTL